jgi:hypothetical protein
MTTIARYLAIAHSAASLAVRKGEELSENRKFTKVLKALRPKYFASHFISIS